MKVCDGARAQIRAGFGIVPVCLSLLLTAPVVKTARAQDLSTAAIAETSQPAKHFNIPSGDIGPALTQWAETSGFRLLASADALNGIRTNGVSGLHTTDHALDKLLADTGLRYILSDRRTVTVVDPQSPAMTALAQGVQLDTIDVVGERGANGQNGAKGFVATHSSTGTKTGAPLIETPQSISVVTSDQLKTTNPASLADAVGYTPGVTAQSPAFSQMVDDFMIRGFNASNGNTGMLRDGMKLQSNVYDGGQEPYGLERIDILRGPASVLYGQLAPGGVINAISKRPTMIPFGEVNVEYGRFDRKQFSADIGGPLSADGAWLYRLTGLWRDGDNWVDGGPDDRRYFAPALTWRPTDATSLTILGTYQQIRTRFAPPLAYGDVKNGIIPRGMFLGEPSYDLYDSDVYTVGYLFEHGFNKNVKLRNSVRYFEADVIWNYMLPSGSVTAAGILNRRASDRREKSTGITTDTSLEAKFSIGPTEHTLLAGVDSYRRTYDTHRYRGATLIPLNINNPVYFGTPVINRLVDVGSDSIGNQAGIYLQDQIKLYDKWVVLMGGRYDWADSETTNYQNRVTTEQKDEALTGRAGLVYLFDNGLAPYVSVSQAFTPQIGVDIRTNQAFRPSEGVQYEAGVRYQPPGTNILLSAAVYDITQTNVVTIDGAGNQFQQGEVRSRGAEAEARASFGNLNLVAAYAYTDARVTDSVNAVEVGERPNLVPLHTFAFWGDYGFDDVGLKGLRLGAGVRYLSSANILGYTQDVPGYALIDAMVHYDLGVLDPALRGLSLQVNARNLFDKNYFTCAGATGCRYGEPRIVTGKLSYRW